MSTVLIQRTGAGHLGRLELLGPRAVSEITEGSSAEGLLIVPIRPLEEAIGVLLVPDEFPGRASRNGVPLDGGMHVLEHGDQIDVGPAVFWIAAEAHAERVEYDPAQHGSTGVCSLTRVKLSPTDDIVICPGLPGKQCGAIYEARAWELAMQSAKPIRCRNCGFHPSDAAWTPPDPRERTDLDELLQLVEQPAG